MNNTIKNNSICRIKDSVIKEIKPSKGIKKRLKSPTTSYLNELLFKEYENNNNNNNNNSMQFQF